MGDMCLCTLASAIWNVEHNPRTHWQPKCHNLDWIAGLQSETGALQALHFNKVKLSNLKPCAPTWRRTINGRGNTETTGYGLITRSSGAEAAFLVLERSRMAARKVLEVIEP